MYKLSNTFKSQRFCQRIFRNLGSQRFEFKPFLKLTILQQSLSSLSSSSIFTRSKHSAIKSPFPKINQPLINIPKRSIIGGNFLLGQGSFQLQSRLFPEFAFQRLEQQIYPKIEEISNTQDLLELFQQFHQIQAKGLLSKRRIYTNQIERYIFEFVKKIQSLDKFDIKLFKKIFKALSQPIHIHNLKLLDKLHSLTIKHEQGLKKQDHDSYISALIFFANHIKLIGLQKFDQLMSKEPEFLTTKLDIPSKLHLLKVFSANNIQKKQLYQKILNQIFAKEQLTTTNKTSFPQLNPNLKRNTQLLSACRQSLSVFVSTSIGQSLLLEQNSNFSDKIINQILKADFIDEILPITTISQCPFVIEFLRNYFPDKSKCEQVYQEMLAMYVPQFNSKHKYLFDKYVPDKEISDLNKIIGLIRVDMGELFDELLQQVISYYNLIVSQMTIEDIIQQITFECTPLPSVDLQKKMMGRIMEVIEVILFKDGRTFFPYGRLINKAKIVGNQFNLEKIMKLVRDELNNWAENREKLNLQQIENIVQTLFAISNQSNVEQFKELIHKLIDQVIELDPKNQQIDPKMLLQLSKLANLVVENTSNHPMSSFLQRVLDRMQYQDPQACIQMLMTIQQARIDTKSNIQRLIEQIVQQPNLLNARVILKFLNFLFKNSLNSQKSINIIMQRLQKIQFLTQDQPAIFIEIAYLLAFFRAKGNQNFWNFIDKSINNLFKQESLQELDVIDYANLMYASHTNDKEGVKRVSKLTKKKVEDRFIRSYRNYLKQQRQLENLNIQTYLDPVEANDIGMLLLSLENPEVLDDYSKESENALRNLVRMNEHKMDKEMKKFAVEIGAI